MILEGLFDVSYPLFWKCFSKYSNLTGWSFVVNKTFISNKGSKSFPFLIRV